MKYIEIIKQDKKSLISLLKEKKMLLFSLRNKLKLMQVTNTNELREVKKDIAKINMAISQKEESKNA
jgi:large subunit ribosomal protein L29